MRPFSLRTPSQPLLLLIFLLIHSFCSFVWCFRYFRQQTPVYVISLYSYLLHYISPHKIVKISVIKMQFADKLSCSILAHKTQGQLLLKKNYCLFFSSSSKNYSLAKVERVELTSSLKLLLWEITCTAAVERRQEMRGERDDMQHIKASSQQQTRSNSHSNKQLHLIVSALVCPC